ncbi:sensor histidine kinase [Streptomyces kanamyceticus]|uniref:histidine kinase n=1 Tax=Streptomyces kanamyceticus TaxID=1967 RepID=A0A5J6GF99_STRKN|nr:ATP-binding protein [Streptomyces kanamyceticus]QEU93617.1 sensor histidine kinase [Streptomyces kanamyceticus]
MTAPTPLARPGTERPELRPSALVLLTCALVTSALTGASVALAPDSARTAVAWGAGAAAVALSAAVTFAFHAMRTAGLLRLQLHSTRQDAGRLQQEQARRATEFGQEHARLTAEHEREKGVLTQRARTAESERAAALAACANAAGRMQALATGMLADLREMETRHADEDVLTDLLHLDHRTAQAGRIADSVAVLTGARSGRRWARPIVMESILRGAMGRIGGYQRVRVHSASEVAVAGHAAEGVMHALAELLDNAANFSPPTSEVHVYIEEVAAGVIVSVEDSGLVMGPVQQRRAERAVSGTAAGLGRLSGTRLGLPVVGRLARKHGLTVSFRPSARGGTGVLLLIPQELISRPSDATPAPATLPAAAPAPALAPAPVATSTETSATVSVTVPAPATRTPEPYEAGDGVETPVDRDPVPTHESAAEPPAEPSAPGGLPKRPRGRTLAAAESARARAAEAAPRTRTAADASTTAARFSSFRQAVRATDPDAPDAPATPPHPEGDTPR